nr:TSL-kinase interacting protein 1-like isoform X1 [Ipomoea batatas]
MELQLTLGSEADHYLRSSPRKDGDFTFGKVNCVEQQIASSQEHAIPEQAMFSQDHSVTEQLASFEEHSALQQPVKRQTRKWAAWTREEEESFFSALRHVGKNFEKITSRVQSKNKDQVRHYYYRLVRRMNKLLGPELCLNAKNSRDTNAAMLRWWSLLEKYSCKASKLHLKPRRFKIFIETLENQLLKDRKKNVRRCFSQGENTSTAPISVSNQGRASGHDGRSVKVVLLDNQDIHKFGSGKGSSLKRHINIGANSTSCKTDSSLLKTARHRRKIGATAAYKRWEKAAIAGVSLVADAAEHLERTTTDKEDGHFQDSNVRNVFEHSGKDPHVFPALLHNSFNETNLQNSGKLKLQLFPIDDGTRRALELDNHNPYLELTLSTRKKMSSVLEHLNRKWGNSSMACGDLMLFPYHLHKENLVHFQKWTKDTTLTAADVYALTGSPPVFRLRYGWFSNAEVTFRAPVSSAIPSRHDANMNIVQESSVGVLPAPSTDPPKEANGCVSMNTVNASRSSDHTEAVLWENPETVVTEAEVDDLQFNKAGTSCVGEWADSLTNISVGDLLSEAPDMEDANCITSSIHSSSNYIHQIPFSCDSFDAAIAAHIKKHQSITDSQTALPSQLSSIWGAEDTCDAFAFQRHSLSEKVQNASKHTSLETCKQITLANITALGASVEDPPGARNPVDDAATADLESVPYSPTSDVKDFNGLSDVYWPDSLGPLDLDIPSSRYHSELILSDSLGGLTQLIASSLDAFQNCSFFGADKKEPVSTTEAQEPL